MNYKKIYESLIERGRNRKQEGYIERHHILPRCLGGKDNKENLVDLTAREHFIAHLLLTRIYPHERGVFYAVNMMTLKFTEHRARNRLYGSLREKLAIINSEDRKGEKNHFFGKTHTSESRKKISESRLNAPPASKETGEKISKANTGRKHSEAAKAKKVDTRRQNSTIWHAENTLKNISKAKSGTRCINNGLTAKYVSQEEFQSYLDNGWSAGKPKRQKTS